MKDEMRKLTAEIDGDSYANIARAMHHGQMTQMIRTFAYAIEKLILNDQKDEIFLWLYGSKGITLPPPVKNKKGDFE